jgi:hypothetical protein
MVYADEAAHWGALEARFVTKRINHTIEYATAEANTNQAESFFSRIAAPRSAFTTTSPAPTSHPTRPKWGWREDNRRVSNGAQFPAMTGAALAHPVSRVWKGYWQRSV